jgi:phosphoribosylanthranilate isomerase
VQRISESLKFDYVQLHGSESPQFCKEVSAPVIKVLELDEKSDDIELSRVIDSYDFCDYILFDKPKDLNFSDWLTRAIDRVERLQLERPYFFAGGLNPANVPLVLSRIKPYAVDVASGVESAPGLKEMEKMKAFCGAVKGTNIDRANVVNEAIS